MSRYYHYYIAKLGWVLLGFLIVLPCMLMVVDQSFTELTTTYSVLGFIGRITGLLSIVLYCYNLILTTRLSFLETIFGGLNKLYLAHHLIGGLSLCFALLHTVTLTLRAATLSLRDAALFLLPGVNELSITLGILGLWAFIVLMIVTFYVKLPYHLWLLTHKLLGGVFLLLLLHVLLISNDIAASNQLRIYLAVLFVISSIAFIYRTLLPRFTMRRYDYTVRSFEDLGSGVMRLVMEPKNKRLDYKPGQFIFVSFQMDSFSHEWHPFSVSSHSSENDLTMTIKSLGKYTSTLAKFGKGLEGVEVQIEGAYGRFNFRHFLGKQQIWIAGGIGITPFLSMLEDVTDDYTVDLYYSVKSESELIDIPFMQECIGKANGNLRIIPFVADTHGFLSVDKIEEMGSLIHSSTEVLLCGPPPMMHALHGQFSKKGVKNHHIHSEEFSIS